MSADNGIYILESPVRSGEGKEYRVAECMAIENINYVPTGFYAPEEDLFWNLPAIWYAFGTCEVFTNGADARQEAERIYCDPAMEICEYGISYIEMDRPFPTFDEVLQFSLRELEHAFEVVCNDDNPVKSKVLYNIRISLMTVLHLLVEGIDATTRSQKTKEE